VRVVRAHYWEQVSDGRLPRESDATIQLLTSTDCALDEVDQGVHDWNHLAGLLEVSPRILDTLQSLDAVLPSSVTWDDRLNDLLVMKKQQDAYYILSSYIIAHEHAQRKIATYFGDDDSEDPDTPEEKTVVEESRQHVASAKKALEKMNVELKTEIVTSQVANMVLQHQQSYVNLLIEEGLLTPKEGTEFTDEIVEDETKITKERRKHAKQFVKMVMARGQRASTMVSVHGMKSAHVVPTQSESSEEDRTPNHK